MCLPVALLKSFLNNTLINKTFQYFASSYYFRRAFSRYIFSSSVSSNFNKSYARTSNQNTYSFIFSLKNNLKTFSTEYKSNELNVFLQFFKNFKNKIFSSLALSESWAAISHLFWVKTRVIYYVNNWIYTTNHKRIAVNYFWFVILSGIVGMVLATLIRLEFAYPGAGVFVGDSLQYLSLATAHGVIMVFFMIMPLLFGAFANFLLPTQLGVHDVAFPRLNSAAFWFLPGGLLMLCQLVCVDKRYQRMNCFNIREIQSILKKKFFPDLINSHDHHEFLNKTVLGLRFKTQGVNAVNSNIQTFYNYGIENTSKIKSNNFIFDKNKLNFNFKVFDLNSINLFSLNLLKSSNLISLPSLPILFLLKLSNLLLAIFFFFSSPVQNLVFFFTKIIGSLITALFCFFNVAQTLFLNPEGFSLIVSSLTNFIIAVKTIVKNLFAVFSFNIFYNFSNKVNLDATFLSEITKLARYLYNLILTIFKLIYNTFFLNVVDFRLWTLKKKSINLSDFSLDIMFLQLSAVLAGIRTNTLHDSLYTLFGLNYNSASTLQKEISYKFNSNSIFNTNDIDFFKTTNMDTSALFREVKFYNPTIKYNYKSGDYFNKFNKDMYSYLFAIIADLTSLAKLTPWFYSDKYIDLLNANVENFFEAANSHNNQLLEAKVWTPYVFCASDGFYNFFFELSGNSIFLNAQYLSSTNFQQKFYKMFHTNSIQQRILGNWRQLKFTREAWRCKLLSARHQKTLFRRFAHEDGVFWSIERNAKDLLPGWAMITPFSSRTRFTAVGKTDIGLMGVLLVLNSSIISAANFLVTYRYLSTLNNRKMRDARSFFTEGVMVSSWMMVTANPMLVIGIIMLLSDRHWQTSFFDYSGGGDTVLFQHMFWFFGHPEVYIIIIPTFGFTNTMLSYYFRKRVSARASLLYSMYTIAFLGFFVWGHHMYMVGLAHTTRMLFSTLTVMISVPAATKIMHWCVTFVNSSFATELPLLFILTFIFFFVSGGISGMCVAHTGMDVLFHDTFYVIGHFHVMLAGSAMFASFGAFYFYFPAIFGVKYSRLYAYLHYSYYLLGQLMTVIPMFWLGYAGMPRRVLDYPASLGGWHSVVSAGHMLSVAGLISFFIMIFDSLRQGRAVVRNTFGISRYNTRLNFYLYAVGQHIYAQQKGLFLFKFLKPGALKLNKFNYKNHEPLETVLISYTFYKK